MKCEGVSDDDARRAVLPTSPLMTMSGVVSHLRWVEWSWLHTDFLGEPDTGPWTEEEPDREFTYRLDGPLSVVLQTPTMCRPLPLISAAGTCSASAFTL